MLCCDRRYAPAVCVCLTSLYLSTPRVNFQTYVFTHATDNTAFVPEVMAAFDALSDTFQRQISLVKIGGRPFGASKLGILPYLTEAAYDKLVLPALVDADTFLYLDADTVVQDSIEPLLRVDLGQALIAGALDGKSAWVDLQVRRLGLPRTDPYLNSGVMIMNAALWRKERTLDRMLAWYATNRREIMFADQDVLNWTMVGRKRTLDQKWNTLQTQTDFATFDPVAFRGIFHFTSMAKPWRPDAPQKAVELYTKYARISPLRMPEAA